MTFQREGHDEDSVPNQQSVASFDALPGRVFLDTCVVNMILNSSEQIHDGAEIPNDLAPRVKADIQALCGIFDTGQRAFWQFAISPHTYREVSATQDLARAHALQTWFAELWCHWREFLRSSDDFPTFKESEQIRVELLMSGVLDVLPDAADRILICDAIAYRCDAFCTRDWTTILKHRQDLIALPLRILTPTEWWAEIRPWAAIWC